MERSVKAEHVEDLGGVTVKVLNAVVVRRCSCGEEMTGIPDMPGLARAAAMARALNPACLSGKEVRFIRRALDMTQQEFAEKMDLSPEHVSRWENDHKGVGAASEKLVRHNACALLHVDGVCEYDPKVIATMRFFRAKGALPPIEMVRVRLPHKAKAEEDGVWSEAA
jgi:transcriptional regulator with XRE-family HTH domain